jgi:hypothetical protein
MSGESAEKRRFDEEFDFTNVTPVKYVTGERTEKLEMEWEVRNFLTALAMSSDGDSPGIRWDDIRIRKDSLAVQCFTRRKIIQKSQLI